MNGSEQMNVRQAPTETTASREAPGSTGTRLHGNLLASIFLDATDPVVVFQKPDL